MDGLAIIRSLPAEKPTLFVDLGAETTNIFLSEGADIFIPVRRITAAFISRRRLRGVSA